MAQQAVEHDIEQDTNGPSGSRAAPSDLQETALPPSSDTQPPAPLDATLPQSETCVICLDHITDKAIALPCRHEQFDFPCLGTWLQRQQVCPLCKGEVTAIKFNVGGKERGGSKIFHLPPPEVPVSARSAPGAARHRRPRYNRPYARGGRHASSGHTPGEGSRDTALNFRRQVYRNKLYSLHVGSNRISRYRNLTPESFVKDEHLTSRARMWIRRELQVFDFLNSSSPAASSTSADRRASNADFLLEYIVAILKSIDLKGSTGQAEELLKDFLGKDNAKLFLHELESWLRSPYEYLKDWDRAVQYAIPAEEVESENGTSSMRNGGSLCHRPVQSQPQSQPQSRRDRETVPGWFSDGFVLGDEAVRTRPG
ncbi:hypothetical protein A1O1_06037 [Capronia coronata CBS 617.96]|uniref:RING-type E3 ubiquitin transferase n=1 Tax=Capronia coronata CBS 617.96 TaxID=1182541 RepID=W9Y8V0_9EURO|nr:uncharacterized protein A1O1_06037 [Capronia coronata CBS 617.96]EXJ85671.1 hypothetical protein A1O1_06037 [Capronia coronata CBS 617.96]